ncbi:putative UDP-galactose 4-epimerase [Trypanosoma conorhini]|uniref:UDP-glucose 4-epimerase n=1 Tax=Trypanosoma conorhini TaxID=83891 RepID=A0A3R7PAM3_9TRYP|nr:putative UDP-galactose 4-epimerase [Trypanosoma conorhini]RNF15565.1 putative UDP-galactose 4-epimerase [Trypanosoma conorhini]
MKVLVCGGAGYIGTHFVRSLLRRTSHSVVILDSLEATHGCSKHVDTKENLLRKQKCGSEHVNPERYAVLEVGDVRDEAFLNDVFTRHAPIDAVVHMCAYIVVPESVRDPLRYYYNNVYGIIRLLEAMRAHNCDKIIFSSTAALFGNPAAHAAESGGQVSMEPIRPDAKFSPECPYGETKLIAEWLLQDCATAYGIKSVCLRYFNACGADEDGDIGEDHEPETHLIPLVLRVLLAAEINRRRKGLQLPPVPEFVSIFGTDYPTPDGTCVRDYVHVYDLSSAHILALDYLAKLKPEDKSRFFSAFNLGTSRGYSVREVIEAARRVTGHPIPVKEAPRREGDPPVLVASGEEAKKALGWELKYDNIEKIIASAWKFHKANPFGYSSKF